MCWRTSARAGQATVEAAVSLPVIFALLLCLLQPAIVLYDRMVMGSACAEACRLLATYAPGQGMAPSRLEELVHRRLGAIPQQALFHVHDGACSYAIELEGDEGSNQVRAAIENRIKLLPLFDAAAVLIGAADEQGCIRIRVECTSPAQPSWAGAPDPASWVALRQGGA